MAAALGFTTLTTTSAMTPHTTRNSRNMMHLRSTTQGGSGACSAISPSHCARAPAARQTSSLVFPNTLQSAAWLLYRAHLGQAQALPMASQVTLKLLSCRDPSHPPFAFTPKPYMFPEVL
jgi:hypothetical protein